MTGRSCYNAKYLKYFWHFSAASYLYMKKTSPNPTRTIILVLLILSLVNLVALSTLLKPGLLPARGESTPPAPSITLTDPALPTETPTEIPPTASPSSSPTAESTLPPSSMTGLSSQGVIFLSMTDGANVHLFAYNPQHLPLTRLTDGNQDDQEPSLSPDGRRLAFSSNSNGFWDIYFLDLETLQITALTNTPEFDGHPTWSSDGQWLAYETYNQDHFEIRILAVEKPAEPPIFLTNGPDNSYAPAWSPMGREIAFVSDRSGEAEIWLAALDQVENRFTNLSNSPEAAQAWPAWSPDGSQLVWQDAQNRLIIQKRETKELNSLPGGGLPTWAPDQKSILALAIQPNQNGLIAYQPENSMLQLPYQALPGNVSGLDWKTGLSAATIQNLLDMQSIQFEKGPAWTPRLTVSPAPPAGRVGVVPLDGLETNYAYLSDVVDDSFSLLRSLVAQRTGWDFLASLENAYLPLTSPPDPANAEDWLFTGRGIAISTAPQAAGWLVVQRQELNGQTYWRIFLKTRLQDGSQGRPLHDPTWDFTARYSGDPRAYEQGGAPGKPPQGYWVDFTDLALRFGWERLPALLNWRTYLPSARFSIFANTGGLTWTDAMLQIYPPEALLTATPITKP